MLCASLKTHVHSEHVPDGVVLAVDPEQRGVRDLLVLGVGQLGLALLQLVRCARLGSVHGGVEGTKEQKVGLTLTVYLYTEYAQESTARLLWDW